MTATATTSTAVTAERRILAIDIPAGLDDELAALATIVALVDPLAVDAQARVVTWLTARFGKAAW